MWKIYLPFVIALVLLTWAVGLVVVWKALQQRWKRQAAEDKRQAEKEAVESFHRLSAGVYADQVSEVEKMRKQKAGK